MQAGTTGINTTRVYNPIKQAQDHDPHGHFVRQWLPALRRVPDAWLLEPWRMPPDVQARCGVRVGHDIAVPLVDLDTATRTAKVRVHGLRAQPSVRAAQAAIVEKSTAPASFAMAAARRPAPGLAHATPPSTPSSKPWTFEPCACAKNPTFRKRPANTAACPLPGARSGKRCGTR